MQCVTNYTASCRQANISRDKEEKIMHMSLLLHSFILLDSLQVCSFDTRYCCIITGNIALQNFLKWKEM